MIFVAFTFALLLGVAAFSIWISWNWGPKMDETENPKLVVNGDPIPEESFLSPPPLIPVRSTLRVEYDGSAWDIPIVRRDEFPSAMIGSLIIKGGSLFALTERGWQVVGENARV